MFTLDSAAREVIEGCRKVVIENGDGLDGCYWADKGLEVCGDKSFREVCDMGGDMAMMVCQVMVLPYLEALFDKRALDYIARRCAEDRRAAAWLLHVRGDGLPPDVERAARSVVDASMIDSLERCPGTKRHKRPYGA